MRRFCLFILFAFLISCSKNEEKQVLSRLETLLRQVEIDEQLGKLELLALSKKVKNYFCDPLELELPEEYGDILNVESDKIPTHFLKIRGSLEVLELSIKDPEVRVDGLLAEVSLDLSALGAMPRVDGKFFEMHRVSLELRKNNGKWKICKAAHIDNLRATS